MADAPKSGRAKPVAGRFEVFELHPTAHLTDEQKRWPVVKVGPSAERFEVLALRPTLTLKLYLDGSHTDADGVTLARAIMGVVEAVSEVERQLGGDGLTLVGRRAEPRTVILTLASLRADGAADRAASLVAKLGGAMAGQYEPVRKKVYEAGSPVGLTGWEIVKSAA